MEQENKSLQKLFYVTKVPTEKLKGMSWLYRKEGNPGDDESCLHLFLAKD